MAPNRSFNWINRLIKHRQFSQKGFTLLELLVAIVIAGIVTSGLLFLVIELMAVNNREESLTQTQQNMKRAIDFITRDVSEAAFVYSDFTTSYNLLAQLAGDGALPDAATSTLFSPSGG
jgi:prepilin-type N-terminal cleavage/methylation domain-containing protein